MKKGILIGFIFSVLIGLIVSRVLYFKISRDVKYVELLQNYWIEDIGYLKKGTILKIDEGMSEGFTRYILYLNLKGKETKLYNHNKYYYIIPYWLRDSMEIQDEKNRIHK